MRERAFKSTGFFELLRGFSKMRLCFGIYEYTVRYLNALNKKHDPVTTFIPNAYNAPSVNVFKLIYFLHPYIFALLLQ